MRAAALGVLFATLLVGVDAYSTCTDHVHEWIRFHDFITEEQQLFIKALKRSLGTTTSVGAIFWGHWAGGRAWENDAIYDEWERIVKPVGEPSEWTWPFKANRWDTGFDPNDGSSSVDCFDAKHLGGEPEDRHHPCVIDNRIQTTTPRNTEDYRDWAGPLGYDTNLDFCEDVVQGMSVGFHSSCGDEWRLANCIADDDGWMFKNRGHNGCPYQVEFEINDMIARGATFIACARYTFWDRMNIWTPKGENNKKSRRYGGPVAWSGLGMILTSGSLNPFSGIKSANQRKSYGMSCSDLATEAHIIAERNSDEQTVCWRFVKDIHDLVCHFNHPRHGMLWALMMFIEDLDPANPAMRADAMQYAPDPLYGELATRLRHLRNLNPLKGESASSSTIEPVYADHGTMAVWPGWEETQESCSADEKAVRDGNGLIDMIAKKEADRMGGYISPDDDTVDIPSEDSLTDLARNGDNWRIEAFHDKDFNGPICMDPDSNWKQINPHYMRIQKRYWNIDAKGEPMFKVKGANADGTGGQLEAPETITPPGGGSGSSRSSAASSAASSASSRFVSYYSTYKSYMSLRWSRNKKENAARWLEKELGSVGRGSAQVLRFATTSLDAMFFGIENSLIKTAMAHGVCESPVKAKPGELTVSRFTADRKCKCEVVEPILEALHEAESKSAAIRADMEHGGRPVKAITLMFSKGAGAHASALGVGASAGMYVMFQWSPFYMFDIGPTGGASHSVNLGTDIIGAGAHVEMKLGIFFGKPNEISEYRKGIDFGLNVHAKVTIGVEIMFLDEYMGLSGGELVRECQPLFSDGGYNAAAAHSLRMLTFPAAPRCINGFAVSVMAGVSTTPSVGTFNVYTSHTVSRSMSIFALSSANEYDRFEVEALGQPVRNYGRLARAAGQALADHEDSSEEISEPPDSDSDEGELWRPAAAAALMPDFPPPDFSPELRESGPSQEQSNNTGRGITGTIVGGLRVDRLGLEEGPFLNKPPGPSEGDMDEPAADNFVTNAIRGLRLDRLDGLEKKTAFRADAGAAPRADGWPRGNMDRMLHSAHPRHRKFSVRDETVLLHPTKAGHRRDETGERGPNRG